MAEPRVAQSQYPGVLLIDINNDGVAEYQYVISLPNVIFWNVNFDEGDWVWHFPFQKREGQWFTGGGKSLETLVFGNAPVSSGDMAPADLAELDAALAAVEKFLSDGGNGSPSPRLSLSAAQPVAAAEA